MISRQFVKRQVEKARLDLSAECVDRLIDDAVLMLSNLIHYKNGATHEDVVTAVLVIGQDVQETAHGR